MKSFNYESMGTNWEITIWDEIKQSLFDSIKKEIILMSNDFDNTYSRFKKDSLISKFSKQKGQIKVPRDLVTMLTLYRDLYNSSKHKLNPLIGSALSDLGYDQDYSLVPKVKISRVPDFNEIVKIIDSVTVDIKSPVLLDLGALGKGYFVDKVAGYLKLQGIKRFLVNGSGDIYYQGKEPISVGLEHPHDSSKVIGKVEMTTGAMCASAGNRRKWRNFHHIIDPHTLKPADEIIAVWIMSNTAALSDALATALFFVEPECFTYHKFDYLILNKEMRVKKSKGFKTELF